MKPSDDETWTEVEQSFFASAPPEEPQPIAEDPPIPDLPAPAPRRPRREIIAWLRPPVAAAWRGVMLVPLTAGGLARRAGRGAALIAGAAGVKVRHAARAGAAGLIAALSLRPVARRRVVFALAGAIVAAALAAGDVALRKGALTNGETAERERPASGPTIAAERERSVSGPIIAPAAPVASPRADVSNRRPHAHRRPVPASSSAQRPVVTAFMDRETYWAHEPRSAPVRSGGSLFSR